jgi:hypothetical protein
MQGRVRGLWAAALLVAACSRPAPDATPEGVVRLWLEKMEAQPDDTRASREAFLLLGPQARANLEKRAERASRSMGRRVEPYEMLAEGRFGLKFRPKTMTSSIAGDRATVDVVGSEASERATVICAREPGGWRVEPELP